MGETAKRWFALGARAAIMRWAVAGAVSWCGLVSCGDDATPDNDGRTSRGGAQGDAGEPTRAGSSGNGEAESGGDSGLGAGAGGAGVGAGRDPGGGGREPNPLGEAGGGAGGTIGQSGAGGAAAAAHGGTSTVAGSAADAGAGGGMGDTPCPEGSTGPACNRCVVYVNQADGSDADDGTTWDRAKASLQAGVDAAAIGSAHCDVWIARGTYAPTYKADPFGPANTATLRLREDVALYGGFSGGELALPERAVANNPTVVSGVVNALRRVVSGAEGARLDGLTITGANGAGLYVTTESMTVAGCTFSANVGHAIEVGSGSVVVQRTALVGNQAASQVGLALGAGIYARTGSSLRVERSTFRDNVASVGRDVNRGAAIYTEGSLDVKDSEFVENRVTGNAASGGAVYAATGTDRGSFERCAFRRNSAAVSGGAVMAYNSSVLVRDSSFEDNMAGDEGGALYSGPGTIRILRTDFVGNSTENTLEGRGGAVYAGAGGTFEVVGGTFRGNTGKNGGGALACNGTCLAVGTAFDRNSVSWGDSSYGTGGAVYFTGKSAALMNCEFTNNDAGQLGGAIGNAAPSASRLTVVNGTFYANYAGAVCGSVPSSCQGRGGALYNANNAHATVSNSVFWANTARTEGPQIFNQPNVVFTLAHSNVQGSGVSSNGNLDTNPRFVSTAAGALDLSVASDSPCVGAGSNALLPQDEADADEDGDRLEALPIDRASRARIQGGTVDMGAYER